jgi:hypothetical protein
MIIVAVVLAIVIAAVFYFQQNPVQTKKEEEGFEVNIGSDALKIFGIVIGVLAGITILLYFGITYAEKRKYNANYARYAATRTNVSV